jgi:phosphoribosylglycinamide formyltransferase-1
MRTRVGVLISGRGSNMEALIRASKNPSYPAEIATVVSNRPEAAGLQIAADNGIDAVAIEHSQFASRQSFEDRLDHHLRSSDISYIACAGFMRVLTESFVEGWRNRIINIHPSLLPSYRGLHTHRRVIADGVRVHGCTVHFVRSEVDDGPIIAQGVVAVLAEDTPNSLAARVLSVEHAVYPMALGWLAAGAIAVEDERVVYRFDAGWNGDVLISPSMCE